MRKIIGSILLSVLITLSINGCGKAAQTITETNTEHVYVTEFSQQRAGYAFENTIMEPVNGNGTFLLLNMNESTGVQPGGASIVANGKFGNALCFSAATQNFSIAHTPAFQSYQDLEISLWINPAPLSATYKTLVAKWETTGELEYRLCLYSNRLVFYTSYNGVAVQSYLSYTDKQIVANKWNQVAVSIGGNYLTFYINGAPAGRFYMNSSIRKGTSAIQLGARLTDAVSAEQYIGYMDAVKISSGAQADVSAVAILDSTVNDNVGSNFSHNSGVNSLDGTKSIVFNGVDDYVCVGSNPSLDLSNQFTLEADLKPEGTAANQYVICKGAGAYTTKFNYYLRLNANRPTVGFQDVQGTLYELSAPVAITNGVWVKVAAVWDGEYLKLFIDGLKVAELLVRKDAEKIMLATNDCPLMLGRLDYSVYFYKGEMDNVKISDQVKY